MLLKFYLFKQEEGMSSHQPSQKKIISIDCMDVVNTYISCSGSRLQL
jgi:hypothetical protein